VEGDTLIEVEAPFAGAPAIELTAREPVSGRYLIVSAENQLYLYGGGKLQVLTADDAQYMRSNVVVSALWLDESKLALGTLRGGVVILEPATGRTVEICNYHAGLPDNEVFALYADANKGLWVAHDYGFTRLAPSAPLRTYNPYGGLEGNLLCVNSFNRDIYVGTSLGLFRLARTDVYDTLEYFVDVPVRAKKTKARVAPVEPPPLPLPADEIHETKSQSKKKGFLGIGKKERKESISEPAPPKPEPAAPVAQQQVTQPQVGTIRTRFTKLSLRSMSYSFRRVGGITGKVTQLVKADSRLFAAGTPGLFEITGDAAVPVISKPVRYMAASSANGILIASTYNDEVRTVSLETGEELNQLDSLSEFVSYIHEDGLGRIWLTAADKVIRLDLRPEADAASEIIPFSNPFVEQTFGVSWGRELVFSGSSGFARFDENKGAFVRIDSLPAPVRYFFDGSDIVYHDSLRWRTLKGSVSEDVLRTISLLRDVRFIQHDLGSRSFWVISSNNELYRIAEDTRLPDYVPYPLYLKEIRTEVARYAPTVAPRFSQEEGMLEFHVAQADYTGLQATQFRYRLEGMQEAWSDWAGEYSRVKFPFLPPGQYRLAVQSRDVLGKTTNLEPFEIRIQPPYWQRPWFYGVEFATFAILVFLSLQLSSANSRYRHVSRFLMAITIVMLIQFISTVASFQIGKSKSPVQEFFVQVGIALLVLPVESGLRWLMARRLEASLKVKPKKR
jgi:hypothetical protein